MPLLRIVRADPKHLPLQVDGWVLQYLVSPRPCVLYVDDVDGTRVAEYESAAHPTDTERHLVTPRNGLGLPLCFRRLTRVRFPDLPRTTPPPPVELWIEHYTNHDLADLHRLMFTTCTGCDWMHKNVFFTGV